MLSVGLGIKPWRGPGASLLALSSVLVTFVGMSRTRRTLDSLCSVLNVSGEESLRRRVPRERTHVERQAMRMTERREETWRRPNQERVAAFLQLYLLAMVYRENAHRNGHQSKASAKMLNKALARRVIPWIYHNRIWTMEESQWPISMEQFKEVDQYLAAHLCRLRARHHWQMIRYYYGEIEREQE